MDASFDSDRFDIGQGLPEQTGRHATEQETQTWQTHAGQQNAQTHQLEHVRIGVGAKRANEHNCDEQQWTQNLEKSIIKSKSDKMRIFYNYLFTLFALSAKLVQK